MKRAITVSRAVVARRVGVSPQQITLDSDLIDELGLDELDIMQLTMDLESVFAIRIPDVEIRGFRSVRSMAEYLITEPALAA